MFIYGIRRRFQQECGVVRSVSAAGCSRNVVWCEVYLLQVAAVLCGSQGFSCLLQ